MKKRKWGFFPFDATSYKAAQTYLDKKAAQGWVLDKIVLGYFARFVPAEGRIHAVDFDTMSAFDGGPDEDYLNLCADAGWELVKAHRRMLLFRSLPGVAPTPLNTDEGMEAERFWKKCVRRNLLWLVVVWLFYWTLLFLAFRISTSALTKDLFCTNTMLVALPLILLVTVYTIWEIISLFTVFINYRLRRQMISRRDAWAKGIMGFAMVLLLVFYYALRIAEPLGLGETVDVAWTDFGEEYTATVEQCRSYPVVTAPDLGLEPSDNSRYLDGRQTLLTHWLDYSEITSGSGDTRHILTTERYDCAGEGFAEWFFDQRRKETANGSGFLWGKLAWESVGSEYGFDEVCFARQNSYLLARDGNIVVLVGASDVDLTGHMDTIRERLELD